jgi:D,D-heptose 1,7-bisphosphate phosphatase
LKKIRFLNEKAIFLDRDGTIIEECHLLHKHKDIKLLDDAARVIGRLKINNYKIIVVTNQSVVSRGICTEKKVNSLHEYINQLFFKVTNEKFDDFLYCPHHPEATLLEYRQECNCRKPRSGMLEKAAKKYNLNLKESYMIGDRITDIISGCTAGCKTILFGNNPHAFKYNISPDKFDEKIKPDFRCKDWPAVEQIILPGK